MVRASSSAGQVDLAGQIGDGVAAFDRTALDQLGRQALLRLNGLALVTYLPT